MEDIRYGNFGNVPLSLLNVLVAKSFDDHNVHNEPEPHLNHENNCNCTDKVVHTNDVIECPQMATGDAVRYMTYGICIPVIASIGIVVNLASFVIWTRPSMRSSINIYLAGLSFFDGFLLLFSLAIFPPLVYCESALACSRSSSWCQYVQDTARFTYPLLNITQAGSVCIVTAITVDRFIATMWPLKVRSLLTVKRALATLSGITVWSILYNIPIFFELELDEHGSLVASKLRNSPLYIMVYKSYCYLLFMFLIPALTMVCLNCYIRVIIHQSNVIRRRLTRRGDKEYGSTTMTALVVSSFLMLNLTANVTNCLEGFSPQNSMYKSLVHIGNLLVTINSATNFVIYCVMSSRFRKKVCSFLTVGYSKKVMKNGNLSSFSNRNSSLDSSRRRNSMYHNDIPQTELYNLILKDGSKKFQLKRNDSKMLYNQETK